MFKQSQLQTAMERMQKKYFFLLVMVFFDFCMATLLYLLSSKGIFRDWRKAKIY